MYDKLFDALAKSKFRSRFKLKDKDKDYIAQKGIAKRIAPAEIPNDGKQTPMRGHPVFIAQHATATCCRGCIEKWHKFPKGQELNQKQQEYLVDVIMEWIRRNG